MVDDRVFFGGNITMLQSRNFSVGVNYINLTDIAGTSNNTGEFKNPVITGNYKINIDLNDLRLQLDGESGISKSCIENDRELPILVEDYFNYAKLKAQYKPLDLSFEIAYRNVGQGYRSAGAQMRRLKYASQAFMFDRYTNEQIVRPVGMWDIHNDPSLYKSQIQVGLAEYYPQYNNIDPYGLATPNRKGFDFSISHQDEDNRFRLSLDYGFLSEIVGLGTDELKKFNSIAVNSEINIHNMLENYDKQIKIQLGFLSDKTNRSGEQAFINSDLNTQRIYAGFSLELTKNLYYLMGYEHIQASGNDQLAVRNQYDIVEDLNPFSTELTEKIFGQGLRYEFDDHNNLQILWQKYNWSNPVLEVPDYGFNRLSVIYLMKF
jgi:hypothetical protein